jgi:DHA2 family multidrug resistance protein
MAYNDGFVIMGAVLIGCIGLLWFAGDVRSPSGPGAGAH